MCRRRLASRHHGWSTWCQCGRAFVLVSCYSPSPSPHHTLLATRSPPPRYRHAARLPGLARLARNPVPSLSPPLHRLTCWELKETQRHVNGVEIESRIVPPQPQRSQTGLVRPPRGARHLPAFREVYIHHRSRSLRVSLRRCVLGSSFRRSHLSSRRRRARVPLPRRWIFQAHLPLEPHGPYASASLFQSQDSKRRHSTY